jgi:hypothetical protein
MKTKAIAVIILVLSSMFCFSQQRTTVYKADVFNGYDNRNTVLSIQTDETGRYFINSKYEDDGTVIGDVEIGVNRDEAVSTLKRMDYFVSHQEIMDMSLVTPSGILIEFFKTSETVYYEEGDELTSYDFFLTYIADEENNCFEIPDAFVTLARRHLKQ